MFSYGQLQSGLNFELNRAAAVSGAQNYGELCIAAKNEEKRLTKREQHGRCQGKYNMIQRETLARSLCIMSIPSKLITEQQTNNNSSGTSATAPVI